MGPASEQVIRTVRIFPVWLRPAAECRGLRHRGANPALLQFAALAPDQFAITAQVETQNWNIVPDQDSGSSGTRCGIELDLRPGMGFFAEQKNENVVETGNGPFL